MKEPEPESEDVLRYARLVARRSECHPRHVDEIAEEAQELYLAARGGETPIESWHAWVREVVRRIALRYAGRDASTKPGAATGSLPDPRGGPLDEITREARAVGEEAYLEHARSVLPPRMFALVELVLGTSWSVGRIARVAGVEKKRAREILLGALKKLRKYPPLGNLTWSRSPNPQPGLGVKETSGVPQVPRRCSDPLSSQLPLPWPSWLSAPGC